jgi:hypothetical protein
MYEDPMYEDLLARELRNQAYARVDAGKHASPRSASARSPLSDLLNDDYADQLRRARRAAEIEQEAYEYAVREVLGDRGGADLAAARRAEDEESRLREAIAAQEAEIRAAEAEIRRRREVESVEREIAAQEAEIRAAEAELRRREEAEKRDDEELWPTGAIMLAGATRWCNVRPLRSALAVASACEREPAAKCGGDLNRSNRFYPR